MAKPKITIKEAKLIKGIAEGKTKRQAAMEAYNTNTIETAAVIASEVLRKPNVQEALHAELQRQGITLDAVVKPVADGLVAEKVHIVGNGDSAMAEIVPDHTTRLASVKIASKWLGLDQNEPGGNTYNFVNVVSEQKGKYGI